MHIIGITGNPSSGKDTIAHHLETKGFKHISSGDLLREEMKKYGLPSDRAHMHDFVIEMRKKKGPAYLAEEAAKVISGDTIISGLRNVAEVKALRGLFDKQFVLLAVDAPIEVRYERSKGRGRTGDYVPFEQFKAQEESERHGRPEAQQVDDVIAMADYFIKNDGTKEGLLEKADLFLEGLKEQEDAKKILTLCLVKTDTQVLLGKKKRGFGEGKWNGFGGKVEQGETIIEATRREMFEECGVTVTSLEPVGLMQFEFKGNPEVLEVHVFRGSDYEGEPVETEEMAPRWFNFDEIPYQDMWPDDQHWMPMFLEKRKFYGKFVFSRENEMLSMDIREENFLK